MRHASGVITFTTAVLVLAASGLTLVTPAHAAAATCDGQPATIEATVDGQTLTGTDGPDVITTSGFAGVTVLAGGGDDLICSSSPSSEIDGTEIDGEDGDDILEVEGGPATLRPGPGDDTIHAPVEPMLVHGSPVVWVDFASDLPGVHINARIGRIVGEGDDTVTGVVGFEGTQGRDVFIGSDHADYFDDLDGLGSDDPALDRVVGNGGDDRFIAYHSLIDAGAGDDRLWTGHGNLHGGPGDDQLTLEAGGGATGGAGDDVITTSIDEEHAFALPADTFVLSGRGGSDTIRLTSPEDELGFHRCIRTVCRFEADGGSGTDVLSFARTAGHVHLDLAAGRATYRGAHALAQRFEEVEGSETADVLSGTANADHLDGNGGPDRLFGRGGPDVLHGGKGHDVANGGPGLDRCVAEVRHSCRR